MASYLRPSPPGRNFGKREARADHRFSTLHDVLDKALLPPVPKWINWYAAAPSTGVPMLGNDVAGDCVWASGFHYLQLAAAYTRQPLPHPPTDHECLSAYSAGTGYSPGDPSTDNGTYVMGSGGFLDFWTRTGLMCGGRLNKLTNAAQVDFTDLDNFKQAVALGPVFVGASMSESDCYSPFMWEEHAGEILGGHEFLVTGYETISTGKTYFDVMTWDSEFRATDDWILSAVDEAVMALNRAFFDAKGINPASLDWVTVAGRMRAIAAG